MRWNGVSNPIEYGHPCLGCSEPGFWDKGSFYAPIPLATSTAPEASTERGAAVYDRHCATCHGSNPTSLKTPPDEVPALLQSEKVRAHRFSLEDGDMQALLDYLKGAR